MPTNYDEFERQLEEADKGAIQAFVELHRAITIKAYQYTTVDSRDVALAFGSPVWSGRFRSSFNASVGAPNFAVLPEHPEVKKGLRWPSEPSAPYRAKGVAQAAAQLVGLQPFDSTYIANGLPYARRIEVGGFSLKAPAGVLNVIAEKLAKEYEGVVIKAK